MNFRFWKLGIKFFYNAQNIPSISVTYFDGGLEFQFIKAVMRLDWGYFYSEWAIYPVDVLDIPFDNLIGDE